MKAGKLLWVVVTGLAFFIAACGDGPSPLSSGTVDSSGDQDASPSGTRTYSSSSASGSIENYAPVSITGETLNVGYNSGNIKFKTVTSCYLPNYTLPDGYVWNVRPTYTYKRSDVRNKAVLVVSYTYASFSRTSKLYQHYQLIYVLTFTGRSSGTYTESKSKGTTHTIGTATSFTHIDTNSHGSFTLE